MTTVFRRRIAAFAAFMVALASFGYAFVGSIPTASAASVEPVLVEGAANKSCSDLGNWLELKVDPNENGTFSDGTLEVTISNLENDKTFDWSSTGGVDAVFVKAGANGSYLYTYDPPSESTGDTGLTSPGAGNEISHISFCYDNDTTSTTQASTTSSSTSSTTSTTQATTSTTLPVVPEAACPPPPTDDTVVLPISDPEALRVRTDRPIEQESEWRKQIPGASVAEGAYTVSLGSYDPSHFPVPPGDEERQPYEQWLLEFRDGSGIFAESPATPDLGDDEVFAYYPNIGTVVLDGDAPEVWVRHDRFTAEGVKLPSGSSANSIDPACAYLVPVFSGLGDFVWEDLDGDGIQDEGEPGIEGATVNLWTAVDGSPASQIATTTTAADGYYEFTGLNPGDYIVQFVTPDGFEPTLANQGDDDTIDSDAVNGLSGVVDLGPAEFDPTIDAGFVRIVVPPAPGRIIVEKRFSADAETIGSLPAGETSPAFSFTPSWSGGFELRVDESTNSGDLPAGTYSVAESPTQIVDGEWRWQLVPELTTCSDGSPVNAIVLSEGETVTCTFVNTRTAVQQVTTTTTAPTTTTTQPATTTTAPSTTTTPAVSPSTLPFTGSEDGSLIGIGVAFAVIGLLLLAGAQRRGNETA